MNAPIDNPLRIGTRGSALARWQAEYVADLLRPLAAPRSVELTFIRTEGDRVQNVSLAAIGGQGAFTKEIQNALLAGSVDIAVHSLKDLPTETVAGLTIAAVPPRAPSGDVLVGSRGMRFDRLPQDTRIATGSLRRQALIRHRRRELNLVDIRGNVDTRLRKLDAGEFDALILAQAGLERLGLTDRICEVLDATWMLPAVGQGALALECRSDDAVTRELLAPLDDPNTRHAVTAERSLLYHLGGGCQVPIGAIGSTIGDRVELRGVVLAADGSQRLDAADEGPVDDSAGVGRRLAERLLGMGARMILDGQASC